MPIVQNFDCKQCHVPTFIDNKKTDICWRCIYAHVCVCQMKFKTKEELKTHKPDCTCRDYNPNDKRIYKFSAAASVPVEPSEPSKRTKTPKILCSCGIQVNIYYMKNHIKRKIHLDRIK